MTCFNEEVLNEDCKISDARLIRYCVVSSLDGLKFKHRLAPREFERLSNKSFELLSKKESVIGESADRSESLGIPLELLGDMAGVGGSCISGRDGNSVKGVGYWYYVNVGLKNKNKKILFFFYLYFVFSGCLP